MKASTIQSDVQFVQSNLSPAAQTVVARDLASCLGPIFAKMSEEATSSARYKGGKNADVQGKSIAKGSLGLSPAARQFAFMSEAVALAKKHGASVQIGFVDGFTLREEKPAAKPESVSAAPSA